MTFNSVVLPEPLAPSRAQCRPGSIRQETPERMVWPSRTYVMSFNSTIAILLFPNAGTVYADNAFGGIRQAGPSAPAIYGLGALAGRVLSGTMKMGKRGPMTIASELVIRSPLAA